ncbi:MAG: copper amine oxidase N-terminal domain-containing protein [Clostridia bacterium]|nr:copper amine oxidase N-terminal domain-containing protein [Clostridia bacterium]
MEQKIFKRVLALVCVIALLLPCTLSMADDENPVTVFVDGNQLVFDVNPIIEYGRTMVPMRYIFEALGAEVTWDQETSTAFGTKGDICVAIQIGNSTMFVNNKAVELDVPAMLADGRTLVPVRAISESFNAKVSWDGNLRRVTIISNSENSEAPSEINDNEQKAGSGTDYKLNELSPADQEKLLGLYSDIRYGFEQKFLFDGLSAYPAEIASFIETQNDNLPIVVYDIWDRILMNQILDIQMNSSDNYLFSAGAEDENAIMAAYAQILNNTGLNAQNIFGVSYEKTPKGKNVFLLSFNGVDTTNPMLIQCRYIGIVPVSNGIRYFTSENSTVTAQIVGHEVTMLCEVNGTGRKNYGNIGSSKNDFLKGIDNELK